ncbi:ATP-dependent helicase BRM [Tanacetum coccineum]
MISTSKCSSPSPRNNTVFTTKRHLGDAYNIGIFYWWPTEPAKKLAREWKDMLVADDKIWDQNGFNDLVQTQVGPAIDDESGLVYAYDGSLKLGLLPARTEGKRHRLREAMVFFDQTEYNDSPGGCLAFKSYVPKSLLLDGKHNLDTYFTLVNYQVQTMLKALPEEEFGPGISIREYSFFDNPLMPTQRDDLEEGEIAMSGDAHVNHQRSGSSNHDHDENEDEHVLQHKIKQKRSIRIRPRLVVERLDEKSSDRSSLLHADQKPVQESNAYKHDQSNPSSKGKQNPPEGKITGKATRTNPVSAPSKDALEHTKERLVVKVNNGSGPFGEATMTEAIQRRCKNVIPKIQRRIDKEGLQIIPLLTDLWKRTGIMELIADVQAMLKGGMQYFEFSHEIAFANRDFREARSALTFSGSVASSSPRGLLPIGQTKRNKQIVDLEPEPSPPQRPLSANVLKEVFFPLKDVKVIQFSSMQDAFLGVH